MSATATTAAAVRLGDATLDNWRGHPDYLVAAHCGQRTGSKRPAELKSRIAASWLSNPCAYLAYFLY